MASEARRQKNKQRKQRRKDRERRRAQPPRYLDTIDHATYLIGRKQWSEAREVLEDYERDHPGQRDVLRLLLDIYHHQGSYGSYCRTCRRLLEKDQNNADLHAMLAGGYLADARLASALRAFRRFVETWPDHPFVEGTRDTIARLEVSVDELLEDEPFPEDEALELAAMHEEVLACLASAEHTRAVRFAERLLTRCPDFVPAMNNVSEAYFQTGDTDRAMATSRRVLEIEPENFHALANLSRHLLLTGRREEAESMVQRLRLVRSDKPDMWCKKAETLSYFGDDQGVIDALDGAKRSGCTSSSTPDVAMLYHFAAVAFDRQGDTRKAARYWRDALKIQPGFGLAEHNLADSKKSRASRHGPWSFSLDYWVRRKVVQQLRAELGPATSQKKDEAVARAARRFADQYPEVIRLVPVLLDRGDEPGRRFAWLLAILLETPEMLDALREFCRSQRGPDELRIETANQLCCKGALPTGSVRMWIEGQWKEIVMFGFEITDEPVGEGHCDQVDEWAYDAMQALRRGDGCAAEDLLTKAIEVEPDKPDLLNNLASAYARQGRSDEALKLAREIHQRWPDYFFGIIAMANQCMREGDHEEAEKHLAPLCHRRRLHATEFEALCAAHIRLGIARGNLDAARGWLNMWKGIAPDHPELKQFESRLEVVTGFSRLTDLVRRR